MKKLNVTVIVAALTAGLLTFGGCGKEPSAPSSAPAASPSGAEQKAHAAPNVIPGSHEDWCGEHQVPESMCTKCNPKLIAAFKATGDWCSEHGLPESQCLECNPELNIQRPPKTEAKN